MLMYLLMFIAAIAFRLRAPDHVRAFRIPGGMLGLLFVCGMGITGVLTTLVVSFMPPEGINVGSVVQYETTLVLGLLLMCSPPFISGWLNARRQRRRMLLVGEPV